MDPTRANAMIVVKILRDFGVVSRRPMTCPAPIHTTEIGRVAAKKINPESTTGQTPAEVGTKAVT
jgi:hypothetical protein